MRRRIDQKHSIIIFLQYILTAPLIYSAAVPIFFLDVVVEICHRLSFPVYGIKYVNRKRYIRIDRHKLRYLHPWEKLNCAYCGYVNGVLHYAAKIAEETEKYWCGIMHKAGGEYKPLAHHKDFLPYGDKKALDEYSKKVL